MKKELEDYKNEILPLFFVKFLEKRFNYSNVVENNYCPIEIRNTFNYTWREEWEKAHIFGVNEIRKAMYNFYKQRDYTKRKQYLDFVDNKFNFLPLENCLHKLFDKKNTITYNPKGKLIKLKIKQSEFDLIYKRAEKHNLHQLPQEWLKPERIKFIELHNKYISKFNSN